MPKNKILLECHYPARKLLLDKSLPLSCLVNDFTISCNSSVSNTSEIHQDVLTQYTFTFDFTIPSILELNAVAMICDYLTKNKIVKFAMAIAGEKDKISIGVDLLTYDKNLNLDKTRNMVIHNVAKYINDILSHYHTSKESLDNLMHFPGSKFSQYSALMKNSFFIKLGQQPERFFTYFKIKCDFSEVHFSLVRIANIKYSNMLHINITGMSDPLDIKKDIEFLTQNMEAYRSVINELFVEFNIDDNDNILAVRVNKTLSDTIFRIYNHFDIRLSILDKINLYCNLRKYQLEDSVCRIFKLIASVEKKKLADNTGVFDEHALKYLSDVYNLHYANALIYHLLSFIDLYKLLELSDDIYHLYVHIFVNALRLLTLLNC